MMKRESLTVVRAMVGERVWNFLKKLAQDYLCVPECLLCQALEVFLPGRAKLVARTWLEQRTAKQVADRWSRPDTSSVDRDKRYQFVWDYIPAGSRVVDLGAGAGRAGDILAKKNVEYYGYEIDKEYIEIGRSLGRELRYFDFDDFSALDTELKSVKPDVAILMYSFYQSKDPEKLLRVVAENCPTLIIGGRNMSRWPLRLRYLLGRAPITGTAFWDVYRWTKQEHRKESLWGILRLANKNWDRDVNYSYARIWGYKDFVDLFRDLDLDHKLVAIRKYCIGNHRRPHPFCKLTAFAFQFVVQSKGPSRP